MAYKIQIDDLVKDANAKETEAIEAMKIKAEIQAKELADKEAAKAALLERLGITAEEAALLLG